MREHRLPPDDFMPAPNDGYDYLTARALVQEPPGRALEDVISASMLRTSKRRFDDRKLADRTTPSPPPTDEDMYSYDSTTPPLYYDETEGIPMNMDGELLKGPQPSFPAGRSTDDAADYRVLRPFTRSIITKLEKTLAIMHNVRIAASFYLSDSSAASAADGRGRSVSARRTGPQPPRTPGLRPRGRPRKTPAPEPAVPAVERGQGGSTNVVSEVKRGKAPLRQKGPSKAVASEPVVIPATPVPVALRGRRRKSATPSNYSADVKTAPPTSDEKEEVIPDTEADGISQSSEANARKRPRQAEAGRHPRGRASSVKMEDLSADELVQAARKAHRRIPKTEDVHTGMGEEAKEEGEAPPPPKRFKRPSQQMSRWNLRDWSDVLGAAALAGFSPQVLARTRERCSQLFDGQNMTLYTIEGAKAQNQGPIKTRVSKLAPPPPTARYRRTGDDDDNDEDDGPLPGAAVHLIRPFRRYNEWWTAGPRYPALARPAADEAKHRTSELFCTFAGCERAERGFLRRDNLMRHLSVVHAQTAADLRRLERAGALEGPLDRHGAVHIDGYLQPVRLLRGDRVPDVRPRLTRAEREARKRTRREEEEEEGFPEVVYGSESS